MSLISIHHTRARNSINVICLSTLPAVLSTSPLHDQNASANAMSRSTIYFLSKPQSLSGGASKAVVELVFSATLPLPFHMFCISVYRLAGAPLAIPYQAHQTHSMDIKYALSSYAHTQNIYSAPSHPSMPFLPSAYAVSSCAKSSSWAPRVVRNPIFLPTALED